MSNNFHTRGHVGGFCVRRGRDYEAATAERFLVRATQKDDGSGAFEGWAVVYGVRDTYGTTFQAGAFTEGGLDPSPYPLLWMHSPLVPLATFTAEDRTEGLWVAGEYDPTPDGQTARQRALSGSAPELSVGFVWLADGGEEDTDLITSARLVETSQITLRMASVPGAIIQGVREDDALIAAEAKRERAHTLLALRLVEGL